ncbi:MAG: hypothetical protein ACRD1D_12520 [Acidimicrobiales bacterium]
MTVRLGRAGILVVVLYVVVAAATSALSSRPVLPLFDGFAPPVAYNWVNPPPEVAAGNTVPQPVEREFPLGPEGADATNATTEDGQAIVGLDKASVPAHPPDIAVKVRIVPLDPARLGALPPGLRPVSNAYQVSLSYVPSQTALSQLGAKGTVALTAAEAGDKLLFSPDGGQWQERTFRPFGQDNGVFAELETAGYFVVASSSVPQHAAQEAGRNILLLGLTGALPIIGAALVLRLPSPIPVGAASPQRARPKSSSPAARKKARKKARKATKRRRK